MKLKYDLNEAMMLGMVYSDVEFKFVIYDKKNTSGSKRIKSMASFKLKTTEGQVIPVVAYDDKADFTYRNLMIGDYVGIIGHLSEIPAYRAAQLKSISSTPALAPHERVLSDTETTLNTSKPSANLSVYQSSIVALVAESYYFVNSMESARQNITD